MPSPFPLPVTVARRARFLGSPGACDWLGAVPTDPDHSAATESPPERPDIQQLYERYGRAVYRRCQYFLRNDEEARDAMHDVFIKVVQRYDDFRGESSPLTWVIRITTHHCLNQLRAKKAAWRQRYEATAQIEHRDRPDDYGRLERAQLVRDLLKRVNPDVQAAAVYYFVDEMNQEQAAAAAGCSVPTLRKRLRAFIKTARAHLKNADPELVFGPPPV